MNDSLIVIYPFIVFTFSDPTVEMQLLVFVSCSVLFIYTQILSFVSLRQFLGLRLCDRFQSRKIHFEARDSCPFEVGDLIVSVNQHRLSSMHESQ